MLICLLYQRSQNAVSSPFLASEYRKMKFIIIAFLIVATFVGICFDMSLYRSRKKRQINGTGVSNGILSINRMNFIIIIFLGNKTVTATAVGGLKRFYSGSSLGSSDILPICGYFTNSRGRATSQNCRRDAAGKPTCKCTSRRKY